MSGGIQFATMNDARRIARAVLRSERMLRGFTGDQSSGGDAHDSIWFGFKNTSGFEVPSFGIVDLTAFTKIENTLSGYFTGTRPSTTWGKLYAVNGSLPVRDGQYGSCRLDGRGHCAFDSGTPAIGEGWGIKPGQFTLAKGYPQIARAMGIIESDKAWLDGLITQPSSLLCKAVGSQTVGTITTGDYKIWSGGVVGGADSGFTTLPNIYIQADLSDGDFFLAHLVDGQWVSPKGGGKGKIWHATAAADIAAGASGNVLLPDTSIGSSGVVSATNWTDDVAITNSDKIEVYQDPYNDLYYCFKPGGGEGEEVTVVVDIQYDATTHQIQKKTQVVKVHSPATVSGWTMVHQLVADTFATDLDYSEHTLAWNTRDAYVFELGTETAGTPIVFTLKTFVASVYMDGIDEKQYQFDGYCVDPTSETSSAVVDGINCSA